MVSHRENMLSISTDDDKCSTGGQCSSDDTNGVPVRMCLSISTNDDMCSPKGQDSSEDISSTGGLRDEMKEKDQFGENHFKYFKYFENPQVGQWCLRREMGYLPVDRIRELALLLETSKLEMTSRNQRLIKCMHGVRGDLESAKARDEGIHITKTRSNSL